jgi:uncharacterized lipoprotein YmbA
MFFSRSLLSAFAAVLLSLLAGCASSPSTTTSSSSDTTGAVATTADTPRLAPAVAVPAAAKKKLVLALTGPKAVVESSDWAAFQREWRETFGDHARQAGIAYRFSDTAPRPTGEDGTIVVVDVAEYRLVGIGARLFLGVMTGNAHINAKASFSSLRDGTPFGEQPYSTTSSAWGGIFSKMTPQQVDAIATNVFLDLAPAQ